MKSKSIIQTFLIAAAFGLVYWSTLRDLIGDWFNDPNFSHGFLIPFVAGYMVWYRQNYLRQIPCKSSMSGIFIIIFGMIVYMAGSLGAEFFLMRTSMIISLAGIIAFSFGTAMLKAVAVPLCYLIMMIPIPAIIWNKIAFPLQLFAAGISSETISMIGIPVFREGNILHLANTSLEVVDACSGIRSLTSLLALTGAFAFLSHVNQWKKWVIFLSAIPIAVAVNVVRLTITGMLAAWVGPDAAHGFLHDMSGLIVFGIALVLVYLLFILLKKIEKKTTILLTIDVEDWFQVENFKSYISFSTWNSFELRVEKNSHLILDLLDAFSFKPKATFFILGWIAQKLPGLVRQIQDRGHEVASHGTNHHLCTTLNQNQLTQDLLTSKKQLEDITGQTVYGYRAPSFAINDRILESIKQAGYLYDSSYNSFSGHGRYGSINLSKALKNGGSYQLDNHFFELPISNLRLCNKIIPLGGGGYFRLYPTFFFKQGIKNVLKKDNAFIFYTHPWEFDSDQPRVHQASRGFKFRHYINLNKTESKLKQIINSFSDCKFATCRRYLETINSIGISSS